MGVASPDVGNATNLGCRIITIVLLIGELLPQHHSALSTDTAAFFLSEALDRGTLLRKQPNKDRPPVSSYLSFAPKHTRIVAVIFYQIATMTCTSAFCHTQ